MGDLHRGHILDSQEALAFEAIENSARMKHFPISPVEMIASVVRHRGLLRMLVRREVAGRYRGSFLGMVWSLFNPLIMLAVYTFVFSVVFAARWGVHDGSTMEFGLILFAGLMVFNLFSECFGRAPTLVLGNVNYVKKVVFPLDMLPVVVLGAALFHLVVSLAVWLVAHGVLIGAPPVTAFWLPLILLPLCLFIMGLCWVVASLGVYLRDVSQIVGILTTVMLFMSAIFYPVSALPETYQAIIRLNPLVLPIEMVRDAIYFGHAPDLRVLGLYTLGAGGAAWFGFAWFQLTRRGFADAL